MRVFNKKLSGFYNQCFRSGYYEKWSVCIVTNTQLRSVLFFKLVIFISFISSTHLSKGKRFIQQSTPFENFPLKSNMFFPIYVNLKKWKYTYFFIIRIWIRITILLGSESVKNELDLEPYLWCVFSSCQPWKGNKISRVINCCVSIESGAKIWIG